MTATEPPVDTSLSRASARRRSTKFDQVFGWLVAIWFMLLVGVGVVRGVSNLSNGVSGGERARLLVMGGATMAVIVLVLVWRRSPAGRSGLRTVGRWIAAVGNGLELWLTWLHSQIWRLYAALVLLAIPLLPLDEAMHRRYAAWNPVIQVGLLVGLLVLADLLLFPMRSEASVRALIGHRGIGRRDGTYSIVDLVVLWLLALGVVLVVFTTLVTLALDHGWATPRTGSAQSLIDHAVPGKLIIWDLLDVVPGVNIPVTIGWDETPLDIHTLHRGWIVGWASLAFKVIVGATAIATVRRVWKQRAPHPPPNLAAIGATPGQPADTSAIDDDIALLSPRIRVAASIVARTTRWTRRRLPKRRAPNEQPNEHTLSSDLPSGRPVVTAAPQATSSQHQSYPCH